MNFSDLIELSLSVALAVFVLLCLASISRLALSRKKGRSWKQRIPHPGQFVAIRLGAAIGVGAAVLLLMAAALTLNQHRPPVDNTPVVKVRGSTGPTTVSIVLGDCGGAAKGRVKVRGGRPGKRRAGIYSDADGTMPVELTQAGIGHFTLSDPSRSRGLLSCYLQLPKVNGGAGSSIRLTLDDGMEVDTVNSVPAPSGFADGKWAWDCPPGKPCRTLATLGFAVEEGAKQVIVLVLAALFGAIIAMFIGEIVVAPIKRRLGRPTRSG